MKVNLSTFPSKKETQKELSKLKKLGLKYIRSDMVRLGLIEKWLEDIKNELWDIINDPLSEHGLYEQTKDLIKEFLGETKE